MLREFSKKVAQKAKEETTKESIKHRLSWSRVSDTAKAVRSVSGTISLICLSVSQIPLKLPENVSDWFVWAGGFFGIVAGGAWLNKGKK